MHFTYILNIDIGIAIFCKYRIDIVSKLKKVISKHHYRLASVLILCVSVYV